jgi:arginine N-succinyltransferase
MTIVRSVRQDDIDQLWDLIRQATYGMTTLQITKDQLMERVEASAFAVQRKVERPDGNPYVFVMEDVHTGKLVGTSCIFSKIGGFEPFYGYKIIDSTHECEALNKSISTTELHLIKIHDGPTEIGSLFLLSDYRGQGRGRLLSMARFAFMAAHPKRFSDEVIAEMRGVVHEEGICPFWDAIGRHFFEMDFPQADSLSTIDKRFIEDLMPKHPIYTCLLSQEARDTIGKVHDQTKPALAMLQAEGFQARDLIDIFDGGPVVHCRRDSIDAVRRTRQLVLSDVRDTVDAPLAVLASEQNGFRALIAPAIVKDNEIVTTQVASLMLQCKKGTNLLWMPLHPAPNRSQTNDNEPGIASGI